MSVNDFDDSCCRQPATVEGIYADVMQQESEMEDYHRHNDQLPEDVAVRQNMLNHYLGQQMPPAPNQYCSIPTNDPELNPYELDQPRRQSLVQSINQERERYQSLERNINEHQSMYKSLERQQNMNPPEYSSVYNSNLMQYATQNAAHFVTPLPGTGKIVKAMSPAASRMAINGSDPDLSVHVKGVTKEPASQIPCMTRYIVLSIIILCCCNPIFGVAALWFALKARRSAPKNRNRLNRLSLILNICGIFVTLMVVVAVVAFLSMNQKLPLEDKVIVPENNGGDALLVGSGSGDGTDGDMELGSGSGYYSSFSGFGDDEDYSISSRKINAPSPYVVDHDVHSKPYKVNHDVPSKPLDFTFDDARH